MRERKFGIIDFGRRGSYIIIWKEGSFEMFIDKDDVKEELGEKELRWLRRMAIRMFDMVEERLKKRREEIDLEDEMYYFIGE